MVGLLLGIAYSVVAGSAAAAISSVSDIFGSWLYDKGGFGLALAITMIVTALIMSVLLLVPRQLIATRDSEVYEAGPLSPAPAVG